MLGPFKVIGFTGPARSGKDTAADFLATELDLQKVSFATPLKAMLRTLGLTDSQLNGDLKEVVDPRFGCTPRHMMQTLGTEWGRDLISQDIWVQALHDELVQGDLLLESSIQGVVVADVRLPNEAEWVREHGVLIHVERDIRLRSSISTEGHKSEKGITPTYGDKMVFNNGSPEMLYERLTGLDL